MEKEYITVTEAAKRMGVSRVTMSKAVNAGKYVTEVINLRPLLVWENNALVKATVKAND